MINLFIRTAACCHYTISCILLALWGAWKINAASSSPSSLRNCLLQFPWDNKWFFYYGLNFIKKTFTDLGKICLELVQNQGVSPKIIINTGFSRTPTYESLSQVTDNLLTVWEAHAEICSLPQLERTEVGMHYECTTARNQRQGFHALVTRMKMEQTLLELDLRLRTQEAAVLFPKDRCVELGDSYCKPFDLSQNKCEFWNFISGS